MWLGSDLGLKQAVVGEQWSGQGLEPIFLVWVIAVAGSAAGTTAGSHLPA